MNWINAKWLYLFDICLIAFRTVLLPCASFGTLSVIALIFYDSYACTYRLMDETGEIRVQMGLQTEILGLKICENNTV